MWFVLLCCIEHSMDIDGLMCWNDRPLHQLTCGPECDELFLMHMHLETDGIIVYLLFSFQYFSLCQSILYTLHLLLLLYYLTFQETIKNQLKGNHRGMVFNGTFNNSSVISWQSILLVAETVGPENH
jgi:hypothetical protein